MVFGFGVAVLGAIPAPQQRLLNPAGTDDRAVIFGRPVGFIGRFGSRGLPQAAAVKGVRIALARNAFLTFQTIGIATVV
jgi:hypothetical protein